MTAMRDTGLELTIGAVLAPMLTIDCLVPLTCTSEVSGNHARGGARKVHTTLVMAKMLNEEENRPRPMRVRVASVVSWTRALLVLGSCVCVCH